MKRFLLRGVLATPFLAAGGFGLWLLSLPSVTAVAAPGTIGRAETAATLQSLRPARRGRPVIAILGANGGTETETTDYIVPLGILRRADVADVMALATHEGPVKLYPALIVEPDATTAAFDARHPRGADYVIVPAMSRDDDPAVLRWLVAQAAKGARIIGVCAGAKVVAAAGLLDGRRATTHWYYLRELLRDHPSVGHVPDRRFVVDGQVATTTGITASMPMMLTLVEAIGGRDKAAAVARDLGVAAWDARHDSDAFGLSRAFALTVLGNRLAFWNREHFGIPLRPDMDEVSLALLADAWSRTYRSRAVTFAATPEARPSLNGLRILPERIADGKRAGRLPPSAWNGKPAAVLDETLAAISRRYGAPTADMVATQLEYIRPASRRSR